MGGACCGPWGCRGPAWHPAQSCLCKRLGTTSTSSLAEHDKDLAEAPYPVRGGHAVALGDAVGQHGAGGGCVGGIGCGLLGPAGQQGAQAELLVRGQAGQEAGVHHLLRQALHRGAGGFRDLRLGLGAGLDLVLLLMVLLVVLVLVLVLVLRVGPEAEVHLMLHGQGGVETGLDQGLGFRV